MRKLLQYAALVSVGTGALALQWMNLPVEQPKVKVEPLTVERMEQIRDAEQELVQRRLDERAARAVFVSAGTRCEAFSSLVAGSARRHHLSPRIMAATIVAESSCQPAVVSKAGAVGLMQVECRHTWRQYTRKELTNPERNADIGADILARYVRQTGSYREGLKRYFGVTPGSDQADIYADKVLMLAGRHN